MNINSIFKNNFKQTYSKLFGIGKSNYTTLKKLTVKPFLSATLIACAIQPTQVVRAAIDIGMSGPKLQIAEIDLKTNRVFKQIHSQRYFVNFYDDISKDKKFSDNVMSQGLEAFRKALEAAKSYNVENVVAVGASAFRLASNGSQFSKIIQNETGVEVKIIDQNLEGILAHKAVVSQLMINPQNLIIWDIGGGSIQLVGKNNDEEYIVYCSQKGSGKFNEDVLKKIKKQNDYSTLLPVSVDEALAITDYAETFSKEVNEFFKNKISESNTVIIGVGSVFCLSLASMLESNLFSLQNLEKLSQGFIGKTEEELGEDEFVSWNITNTFLILGFMKGLGIKAMQIININNSDGVLLYQPFWK